MIKIRTTMSILLLLILQTAMMSCTDDDPVKPPFEFPATLESLWPHADGNSWMFQLTTERCEYPENPWHENREDVPPLPSWEELHRRLVTGFACDQASVSSGSLNLYFDGDVAISPQNTVQRLRSDVQIISGNPMLSWQLSGRLWRKTEEAILGYSEWNPEDRASWVYLTRDLSPGDEFKHQLSPDVVQDLWVKCRIWKHLRVELPDGTMANGVECFYLIDLGIQQATNEEGEGIGYSRSYWYGMVLYVEDVGPILCLEHREGPGDSIIQGTENLRTERSLATITDYNITIY